jgi:hypothetical protein
MDETFRKELARRKAEAESGDAASVIDELLNEMAQDLDRSVVDNRRAIAEADALLGLSVLTEPAQPHSSSG